MLDYTGILMGIGGILTIFTGYVIKKRSADLNQFSGVIQKLENHIQNLEERIEQLEQKNSELNEKYQEVLVENMKLKTVNEYQELQIKKLEQTIRDM